MFQELLDIIARGQQGQNLSAFERAIYKVFTQVWPHLGFSMVAAAAVVIQQALQSNAPIDLPRLATGVAIAIALAVVGTFGQGLYKFYNAQGDAPLGAIVQGTTNAVMGQLQQAGRAYGVPNDVVTGFEMDPMDPHAPNPPVDPHAMTQVQPAAYYQPPKPGAGPNVHGYDLADLDTQERGAVGVQRSSLGIRGHQWHQPDDASEDEESEPEPGRTRPASTPASAMQPPANTAHALDELHTQPALPAVRVPVRTPAVPPRVLNQIAPTDSAFLR